MQIFVRWHAPSRRSFVREQERDHPAEADICARRELVARMRRAGPGSRPRRPPGAAARHGAIAAARCRSGGRMRTASVFRPRRTSQQSNGPGTPPIEFCRNVSRSASAASFVDRDAADDVGVAAEVLGRRVHDDVGAELERALEVRASRRCCRRRRARRAACATSATARDVDDLEHRVASASRARRVRGLLGARRARDSRRIASVDERRSR